MRRNLILLNWLEMWWIVLHNRIRCTYIIRAYIIIIVITITIILILKGIIVVSTVTIMNVIAIFDIKIIMEASFILLNVLDLVQWLLTLLNILLNIWYYLRLVIGLIYLKLPELKLFLLLNLILLLGIISISIIIAGWIIDTAVYIIVANYIVTMVRLLLL